MYNHSQHVNERTISMTEILWKAMERWKPIVCFSLCFMLLFVGIEGWRHSSWLEAENSQMETQQKKTPIEMIQELPEDEQSGVTSAYAMNKQLIEIDDYIRESPLMQTNPYQARRLRTDWLITGESNQETKLVKAYVSYLQSDNICEKFVPFFHNGVDAESVREAMAFDNDSADTQSIFSCEILLYEGVDEEALRESFLSAVKEVHAEINVDVAEHEIDLLNWNIIEGSYQKLLLLGLHTYFSRGRLGGVVFPSLSEFSTDYCDPHSQRLCHSQ